MKGLGMRSPEDGLKAVNIMTYNYGPDAPDLAPAREVAGKYSKRHVEVVFAHEKMLGLVEQAVQIFKTFDPAEIRNSAVALAGIKQAKNDGYSKIMTGDGSDEDRKDFLRATAQLRAAQKAQ